MKNLKIVDGKGNPFTWVRGGYQFKTINGKRYIVPKKIDLEQGGIYEPNFKVIVEVLASMDYSNENEHEFENDILGFTKKYGVLGMWSQGGSNPASLLNSIIFPENIDDLDNGKTKMMWNDVFNIFGEHHPPVWPIPFIGGTEPGNIKHQQFWLAYREPTLFFWQGLTTICHVVQHLARKEWHPNMKINVTFDGDGAVCPAQSLYEGIIAYAVWRISQGTKLRKCGYAEKIRCKKCQHNKLFFWPSDIRQEIGNRDCKDYNNHRRWILRQQEKALNLYSQGKSIEGITNLINKKGYIIDGRKIEVAMQDIEGWIKVK